ncbi:MAG: beta-lactamase family protein [Saprospiraceae bacterium]|nr:beta-lactamase family protein [Saprospiraceae bacterium]
MKIKLLLLGLLLVFLCNHGELHSQNSPTESPILTVKKLPKDTPESVGMSSERLMQMNKVMHQYVDNGQLAGIQTAVMRKGKVINFDTYGYADLESNTPLQSDAIFRIYSMTKPIVSVALMMLYEQGKFQLNDLLEKYIPEFENLRVHKGNRVIEPATKKIRIIDILRHTSGIGYGWGTGFVDSLYRASNRASFKTNKDLIEGLSKLPLYFEPGTKWKYSLSTDVCGYLVEVLSGQPLDKFLEENIFEPLGMTDTHFEIPDEKDERFVSNYRKNRKGELRVLDHPSTSRYTKEVTMFSGGGGLVSTMDDYLRFSQMLLNKGQLDGKRFLSPKTIELMTIDHTKHTPYNGVGIQLPGNGFSFGLGFSVATDLADTGNLGSVGNYGWGGAAGTFFSIDPKEELIMIMMIQLMPYSHLKVRSYFQTMVYQAIVND